MPLPRTATAVLAAGAAVLALAGCSASAAAPAATGSPGALSGSITVFAAASLKGTFTEIAAAFEAEHPGTAIELTFAGSSDLVTQISNGAPADVFASADEKNMAKLADADLIAGDPVDFATNTLEIAVPPGNPAGVTGFADLARDGVTTVVCAPQVPCGAAATAVETATGVDLRPVSEESSVTDVLGKVTSGEADAGLVYVTDVAAAGDAVTGIAFPESAQAVNTYPIAPVAGSANPDLAAAFTASVAGAEGRAVFAAAGFGAPGSGAPEPGAP
ncbi:molybdate ABC transporter substrate-binding protein [Rathayibacter sp. VKM Ac-2804]|uniref:molybdate ABC transporter substrate-binding protein n=1 Tax=unclassified Rathayibacter TaxID=2609250 RepID=UPI00132EAE07|nr:MULTISPECIES: molybdate ABC transporter substrate-binding protein [unclassified Rathayibacter]NRG39298.1 molybdate ABC transporter substrate-binding protein [Rathayibacter sp. VKM Ac-2835]QHF24429.1 molybdate ABC transporter substrate-binding protein [Rathayibacter sp. VKM Ac-2804]